MGAADRIHRLFQLVELLQSGRSHNAGQLAELCGVSRRTIFRYLNTLQESGIHVHYDEQQQGYHLPSQMYLPPTDFTLEESLAILTLCYELAGSENGVPFHEAARSASLKLASNLPQQLREQLNDVTQSLTIRLDSHNPNEGGRPIYDQFVQAISKRRGVRIMYKSLTEWEDIGSVIMPYRVFVHPPQLVRHRSLNLAPRGPHLQPSPRALS